MLPSSLQIKNRLHVERDSKFRRIVSSFGTTFRNSKWSDYSIKNVNNQPKKWISLIFKYLIFFLILIGTDFLLFNGICLYTLVPYFSFFSDHSDMSITLKILFTESIPAAINEGFKILIVLIFNNGPTFLNFIGERLKYRLMYRDDINNSKSNFNDWISNYFLIRPVTSFNPIFFKNFYINYTNWLTDTKPNPMRGLTPNLLPNKSSFWKDTWYQNLNSLEASNKNLVALHGWELVNVFNENSNNKLNGTFYISNLHYTNLNLFNLNSEFSFITNSIGSQVDTLKLVRWLYKYSVLHRKTLKQSHNLTLSKKLISSGFFDSKIMTNNLWFSDTYSRLSDSKLLVNILKSQWNTMYAGSLNQNSLGNKSSNNLNIYKSDFSYLSLYESSFSYFNKRAYQFLGLNNNLFTTTLKLNTNSQTKFNDSVLSDNQLELSDNLSSFVSTYNLLNPYNHSFNDSLLIDSSKEDDTVYSKDVLSIFSEDDILANDLLRATFNITRSFNKPSQIFSFYDLQSSLNSSFKVEDLDMVFNPSNDYGYNSNLGINNENKVEVIFDINDIDSTEYFNSENDNRIINTDFIDLTSNTNFEDDTFIYNILGNNLFSSITNNQEGLSISEFIYYMECGYDYPVKGNTDEFINDILGNVFTQEGFGETITGSLTNSKEDESFFFDYI